MQKFKVGNIDNTELTFHQCESFEEAQKEGLPQGLHFFWSHGDKRITDPMDVITKVIEGSKKNTLDVQQIIKPDYLEQHYKNLYKTQQNAMIEQMNIMRKKTVDQMLAAGTPANAVKEIMANMNKTIEFYEKAAPFPDINGVFKPTREQAEVLLHGVENVDKFLTPDQQKEIFGDV